MQPAKACGSAPLDDDGALRVITPSAADSTNQPEWLDLEEEVQIRFNGGTYQPGQFWLIPARTASGDVIWPQASDGSGPKAVPARAPRHFYAPLAVVDPSGAAPVFTDCRRQAALSTLIQPPPKPAPAPV